MKEFAAQKEHQEQGAARAGRQRTHSGRATLIAEGAGVIAPAPERLPRHVYADKRPGRYRIILRRGGRRHTWRFASLAAAKAALPRIEREHPAQPPPARSNTGIPGISETTIWRRQRPIGCFIVSWPAEGPRASQRTRRIAFGHTRTRAQALKMAIALRRQKLTAAKDANAIE